MNTPESLTQFEILLGALIASGDTREMILQFTRDEFRRGYLHGKREMKMAAENALASIKVEEL